VDELLLDSRRRTLRLIVTQEHSIHYHFLIAHAVQSRDPLQARVLMLQHILDVTTSVKRCLAHAASVDVPPAADPAAG
jgi:DNA-binding GntR family transcriptional regulator